MKTANYRWNDKVENFNYKLNKLREELNKYKKNAKPEPLSNMKNVNSATKTKQDAKKREFPVIRNDEVLKNIYKRTNGGCALKDKNNNNKNSSIKSNNCSNNSIRIINGNRNYVIGNSKNNNINNNKDAVNIHHIFKKTNSKESIHNNSNKQKNQSKKSTNDERAAGAHAINKCLTNSSKSDRSISKRFLEKNSLTDRSTKHETKIRVLQLPASKQVTNKVAKTKAATNITTITAVVPPSSTILNGNDKKQIEKNKKHNEKKWLIATKHVKVDILDTHKKKQTVDQKSKTKFLHFEGEDGCIQVYPVFADAEVGFHNITQVEDDNLSQVKRENQDDDDIKTTKRLAEWSSELVYRYLEETIEKSKFVFQNESIETRTKELLTRLQE